MTEVINTIQFSDFTMPNANAAWSAENSEPAFPTATHQIHADPARVIGGIFYKFSGTGNSLIRDKTPLTTNVVKARITTGIVGNNSEGVALTNENGVGWAVVIRNIDTRLFNMNTGFVLGSQIGGAYPAIASHSMVDLIFTKSLERLEIVDDENVIATINSVDSENTTWFASGFSRDGSSPNAGITSLSSIYVDEISYTATGIDDPVTPGQDFEFSTTGYSEITSITAEGIAATDVRFNDGVAVAKWPYPIDGGVYPDLPKSGVTFTVSDGTNVSIIKSNVALFPNNKRVPFGVVIAPNNGFLAAAFEAIGKPLQAGDVGYYSDAIAEIKPDSRIIIEPALLPYSGVLKIRRVGDGKIYFHNLTIGEKGEVTVDKFFAAVPFRVEPTKSSFLNCSFF